MGEQNGESDDRQVEERMADLDDESAAVKTYECNDCGYRTKATHQPGECPNCGGDMVDISVSRE